MGTRRYVRLLVCAAFAVALSGCTVPGEAPAPVYPGESITCTRALAPRPDQPRLVKGYLPVGFQPQQITWCSLTDGSDYNVVEITERRSSAPGPILRVLPWQRPYFSDACPAIGSTVTAVLVQDASGSGISLALATLCSMPDSSMPEVNVLRALENSDWETTFAYTVSKPPYR